MMSDALWLALGFMLIFEGIGPLMYPKRWANFMLQLAKSHPALLQRLGAGLCLVGALIVILIQI